MRHLSFNKQKRISTEKVWTETVPWEYVCDGLGILAKGSCSSGDYINYIDGGAGTPDIYQYQPGGTHQLIESDMITRCYCINNFPNINNNVFYGGYQTSNMPIRKSINNGSSYITSATFSNDYIYSIIEHNNGGVDYIYGSFRKDGGIKRSPDGINWEEVAGEVGVSYWGPSKLVSFKDNIYIGNDATDLYKVNIGNYTHIYDGPAAIGSLLNYNNEYMYITYDEKTIYKYNGIDSPIKTYDLTEDGLCSVNYGGLIILGGSNGIIMHYNPLTDSEIYHKTLPTVGGSGSHIYTIVKHNDGYIYAFTRNGTTDQIEIYRMKRELI